jgi:MYXO-CTERM domain-containing protein
MTHSRMMQSLATCFLSAAPSPPPPPPPRFPFFWPLPLLGLFIVPAGRRRVNGGTEGEELSAKAPAAAALSLDLHLACCCDVLSPARPVGLYS